MKQSIEVLTINGEEYVKKSSIETTSQAPSLDGKDYVLVRGDRSGVFVGYLDKEEGKEVVLLNARWIWYWSGAASLAQLSQEGVKNPNDCKFPQEVPKVKIKDVIQIWPVTAKAKKSIDEVKVWKK